MESIYIHYHTVPEYNTPNFFYTENSFPVQQNTNMHTVSHRYIKKGQISDIGSKTILSTVSAHLVFTIVPTKSYYYYRRLPCLTALRAVCCYKEKLPENMLHYLGGFILKWRIFKHCILWGENPQDFLRHLFMLLFCTSNWYLVPAFQSTDGLI